MTGIAQAELADVAARLESRGTKLRPAANDQTLASLEAAIGGSLSEPARALYSTFDGFDADIPDNATMVCLWSAETVSRKSMLAGITGKGQVIGDYFLDADLFRCDLRSEDSKVWWDERGLIAASSLIEFCRQVAEGTFETR